MHNEPITFDPAVREIAHEISSAVRRIRAALRSRADSWLAAKNAA